MSRKIIYLINPISGRGGKSSLRALIERKTREKGIEYSIHPTDAEGRYDHLIPLIDKEGITDIVICGGDGTVSAVAAAIQGTGTRIGIIPMGSGNGLAFAAGIPKKLSAALDLIFTGHASLIDGFTINGHFSCMLCGIGLDGQVAHEFARQKTRGLQTYVRITLANFIKAKPYPFVISLPEGYGPRGPGGSAEGGASFPVDAFFISIANANQFGNQFTIAPQASLCDGLLDIVIARKTGRLRLIMAVIRQVMGGNRLRRTGTRAGVSEGGTQAGNSSAESSVLYFQAPGLHIGNPSEAPLHIDGDPGPAAKEFVIRMVPRAIMLIQPKGGTKEG
jgi:diacylglycerol kinase (ATP)